MTNLQTLAARWPPKRVSKKYVTCHAGALGPEKSFWDKYKSYLKMRRTLQEERQTR